MEWPRLGAMTAVVGMAVATLTCGSGCQVSIGGQTLPSPYYMSDDVQYFPAGPEFKLSREAAQLEANRVDEQSQFAQ